MKITSKLITDLAKLAKLELSKEEIKAQTKDLSSIIAYVDQLAEVDLAEISLEENNPSRQLRADKVIPSETAPADLVAAFPESENNLAKVLPIKN